MKRYAVAFVFCIGLSFLIITLTSTIYFLQKKENQFFNSVPLKMEYDEFKASSLDLFDVSGIVYDFVSFDEIEDLCLKMKYKNNMETNSILLSQKLLGYLQKTEYPVDIIDNDVVHINSFLLNQNLTITFLDFLNEPSSNIYITQRTKENTSVYFICSLADVEYMTHIILDTGEIVVHFRAKEKGYNLLAVFGAKKRQPALLSFFITNKFLSIRNTSDINIGGVVYQPKIERGIIILEGKEEILEGKIYVENIN